MACCGIRFNAKAFRRTSKACPNSRETWFFRSIFVKAPSVCVHRTIHKDESVPWMLIYSHILEVSSISLNSFERKKVWERLSKGSSCVIQAPGVMYKALNWKRVTWSSPLLCAIVLPKDGRDISSCSWLSFFIFISFAYLHCSILGQRGSDLIHQYYQRSQVTFRGAGLLFISCIFLDWI